MKSIKNGLVAAAFVSFLGCNNTMALDELAHSPINRNKTEEAIIEIKANMENNQFCNEAKIRMSYTGYTIECDARHSFEHSELFGIRWDSLDWSKNRYHDRDKPYNNSNLQLDGHVDFVISAITLQPIEILDNSQIDRLYHQLLTDLKKDTVQEIWEERWGSACNR